jgi:transposase
MQGKEASEQETNVKSNVGIDVSKDWLDVHIRPSGKKLRMANTPDGIRQLKRMLAGLDLALVVCEATGRWHRLLWRSFHASGLPIAVTDGYRVRMFARAQGLFAKTDRLDAAVLSAFAATMNPAIRPPAPEILEELAELNTARDNAVAEQTGLKNQLSAAKTVFLRRQLPRRIKALGKVIEAIETEIMARVAADEGLARRYAILTSIPSIGFAVAATLIAGLAELGSLPDKPIAMLAGLAPIADQSGERDGQRVIWGGRARVRRMLYLAAVSAVRCNAAMKAFYQRLRDAGKPTKVAIIAVARKLALLANTLLANDRFWQPNDPTAA